jgi:hypothetical protein
VPSAITSGVTTWNPGCPLCGRFRTSCCRGASYRPEAVTLRQTYALRTAPSTATTAETSTAGADKLAAARALRSRRASYRSSCQRPSR